MEITQEFLRRRFEYDEETGVLVYRYDVAPMAKKGQIAGCETAHGYIKIGMFNKRQMAHRIIWIYMTGDIPKADIDHIDGVKSNNRWANLRLATRSENMCNTPGRAASGVKGVYYYPRTNQWVAQLRLGHKKVYQEYFYSLEDASEAIRINRERLHGEFANHE